MTRKTVFSGIQPTGDIHLGNYLGAIKRWRADLESMDNVLCIVDLHAITIFQDPAALAASSRESLALLIACGIDPSKCLLYLQSSVPAHCELCWILTCVTPVGWLTRMTQYKEKSARLQSVGAGLLSYPVLQTADILLFEADLVPTGADQLAHVELARDIIERLNHQYGTAFKVPQPFVGEVGSRVMALDDPTVKMSKSLMRDNPKHGIRLLDSPSQITKKVKSATTDSDACVDFSSDPKRAGVNNLLLIYQGLCGKTQAEVRDEVQSLRGYGDLKKLVAEAIIEETEPIRARYDEIVQDAGYLNSVLANSAEKASDRCSDLLRRVRSAVGFE